MSVAPPARVVVKCSVDDKPLPGAYAALRLPMWSKNQFEFVIGPSSDDGVIEITGDELTRRTRQILATFPMDYVSFPQEWAGGIGAEVINADDVDRLRWALDVWGPSTDPLGNAADLDSYESYLSTLSGRRLTADVARTE